MTDLANTEQNQQTALANPISPEQELINSQSAGGFIPGIRIIQGMSEILKENRDARQGQWSLMSDLLPEELHVIIGPYRFHALRMKNNKVDLEDFNFTKDVSKYNPRENRWTHGPDTPDFKIIKTKVIPDSNTTTVKNLTGFDVLLFLQDTQKYAHYFIASTALTMTPTFVQMLSNPGRQGVLGSYLHKGGKHSWWLPKLILKTETIEHKWDEEVLKDFLEPSKIYDPAGPNENARPR